MNSEITKIKSSNISLLGEIPPGQEPCAVFDLDNTLLTGDMGDAALAHLIENGVGIGMKWTAYQEMIGRGDIRKAYSMASSAFAGMETNCVRRLACEVLKIKKDCISFVEDDNLYKVAVPRINPVMKSIVKFLQKNTIKVFIISASNQYLVEQAAELFGIPHENCYGMKNALKEHGEVEILLRKITGTVPVAQGKARILKGISKEYLPILGGGDSLKSDIPFLNLISKPGIILWLGEQWDNEELKKLGNGRNIFYLKD
jgi:phosphoserine phosphatase